MHGLDVKDKSKAKVILNEYARRRSLNKSYSKRAFAREIGISHTLFSMIESGRRPVSVNLSKKLISSLDLPKAERDILSLGLPLEFSTPSQTISLESFAAMASWEHYAILSLTEVEGFRWTSVWIAKRLGITKDLAQDCMDRLVALKLIEVDKKGRATQSGRPIVIENSRSSEAARLYNHGLLKKARLAMEELPFEQRLLTSITFSMDPDFLSYANERIRNFRRSLCRELENLGVKKEVYSLCLQLFPLSKVRG